MKHVYGWLLLTPAAILLIAFTHFPAAATLFDSFFSTGTVVRPSRFVGFGHRPAPLALPNAERAADQQAGYQVAQTADGGFHRFTSDNSLPRAVGGGLRRRT